MQLLEASIWLATVAGSAHIPSLRLVVNPLYTVITAVALKIFGDLDRRYRKHKTITLLAETVIVAPAIYFLGVPKASVAFTVSYFSNHLAERINHWIKDFQVKNGLAKSQADA